MRNAHDRGLELQARLTSLAQCFSYISAPRGKELMVAIDVYNQQGELDGERRDRILQARLS